MAKKRPILHIGDRTIDLNKPENLIDTMMFDDEIRLSGYEHYLEMELSYSEAVNSMFICLPRAEVRCLHSFIMILRNQMRDSRDAKRHAVGLSHNGSRIEDAFFDQRKATKRNQ